MKKRPVSIQIVGYLVIVSSLIQIIFTYGLEAVSFINSEEDIENKVIIFKVVNTAVLLAAIVAGYQLLNAKKWARNILTLIYVVSIGKTFFTTPDFMSCIFSALSDCAIIGLLYTKKADIFFNGEKNEHSSNLPI